MLRQLPRLSVALVCALLLWSGATALAATPTLFARVTAGGTLISSAGASGVVKLGTGQYEVRFVPNVSACAYVATTTNAYSQALTVHTAGGHIVPKDNGVYVETKNQGGGLTDGPFDLVVDCGLSGMKYAVVGYTADLVRATAGTVLTPLGSGRYNVSFPSNVSKCAFVATVGDPGNDLVFSPAGVYTGSGPDASTVYVETKNPGGGLQDEIPFHLAVICSSTRTSIAVVSDTGLPNRGSALTSSFRASTGHYAVVTKGAVEPACAAVATRGSVNKSVPFTPATIELVPGPAANTKGFQVRQLLFLGGVPLNESFHAAAVCR